MNKDWNKGIKILKKGGVVVLPTDTIYGIACSVFSKKAEKRIYKIKGRNKNKKLVVLISSISDLKNFGIFLPLKKGEVLRPRSERRGSFFRPKTSVILSSKLPAFRLIVKKNKNLFNLIKKVGPIATTSVNPQGLKPAKNITEAKKYFGHKIDLYINGGIKNNKPSTLIKYKNNKIIILRRGKKL